MIRNDEWQALIAIISFFAAAWVAIEIYLSRDGQLRKVYIVLFTLLAIQPFIHAVSVTFFSEWFTWIYRVEALMLAGCQFYVRYLISRVRRRMPRTRRIETTLSISALRLSNTLVIVEADSNAVDILTLPLNEIIGKSLLDLVSTPADRDRIHETIRQIERNSVPPLLELQIVGTHNIEYIFFALQGEYNTDDQLVGIFAGAENTSARHANEVELQKMIAALEEKDKRFTAATRSAGIGVWEYVMKTQHVIMTEATQELLYGNIEDGSNGIRTYLEFEQSIVSDELVPLIARCLGFMTSFECDAVTRNGAIVHITGTPLIEQSRVISILGTIRDVSKEHQIKKRLELLSNSLHRLALPVSITDMSENRTIIFVNHAEAALHGWHCNDLIGRSIYLFVPAELRQRYQEGRADPKILDGLVRDSVNVTKGGEVFPVRLMSSLLYDRETPIAIVTVCQPLHETLLLSPDITHRFSDSSFMVVILDASGILFYVNPVFSQVFGYAINELNEVGFAELCDDPTSVFVQHVMGGSRESFEYIMKMKDGRRRVQRWRGMGLSNGWVMGIGIDIHLEPIGYERTT